MATGQIEITDIGPIDRVSIPVPEGGGVVVLRGPNGCGKTTALEAVSTLATKQGRLAVKDGAERGEVSFGEVNLRVGRRLSRTGELDIAVLNTRYSIADLIDPGYAKPEAREEAAIKTLAQLAGAGDVSLFYELLGGREEFEKAIPLDVAGSLDVVALAGKVERELHRRAQEQERTADASDARADALGLAAQGVDVSIDTDPVALQARYTATVEHGAALRQQALNAAQKLQAAANAREALTDAEAELKGPTIEQAQAEVERLAGDVESCRAVVTARESALQTAREFYAGAVRQKEAADRELRHAQSNQVALEKFRETVAAAESVQPVEQVDLDAASQAIDKARKAIEQGALALKAKKDAQLALDARAAGGECRKRAKHFRELADGCDEVLSGLVAKLGCPLFVKRGRLLTTTDRGEESFWDLSDGERSEIAVGVFAAALKRDGKPGLLALDQHYWEGLDFAGRRRIAELMRSCDVVAMTAEADHSEAASGPLRAEVFGG